MLINAIRYSKPNKKITVKTKFAKPYLEIVIIDKGPGIPLREQSLIFTPFYRVSSVIPKNPEGSGLGLTIASSFIKKLGGKIDLKSRINKGSQFKVRLPVISTSERFNYLIRK